MIMLGAREDKRCPHYTQLVDTALFTRGYHVGFGDGRRDFVVRGEEYREWEDDGEQETAEQEDKQ